jgi:hypothetical protein
MKIYLSIIVLLAVSAIPGLAFAQDTVFPLPADLYILTSDQMIVRVDATNGGQTIISPPDQPVTDFAIAPDGAWYIYRTSANNAVIVAQIDNISGFVLEFDVPMPLEPTGQSIVWSPDASAVAYLVQGGVRIAEWARAIWRSVAQHDPGRPLDGCLLDSAGYIDRARHDGPHYADQRAV